MHDEVGREATIAEEAGRYNHGEVATRVTSRASSESDATIGATGVGLEDFGVEASNAALSGSGKDEDDEPPPMRAYTESPRSARFRKSRASLAAEIAADIAKAKARRMRSPSPDDAMDETS